MGKNTNSSSNKPKMDEQTRSLFIRSMIRCVVVLALLGVLLIYMWNQAKLDDERMAAEAASQNQTVSQQETVSEND